MSFAYPYVLLFLLLIPFLAWLKSRQGSQAAFLYSSVSLVKGITRLGRSHRGAILATLRWGALGLLILGLARPRLGERETVIKASGIDIVVAIDLSTSMASEDFKIGGRRVNRLAIAKNVLKQFIQKRPNDRIGLIAFSGRAYVAAPLTLDHHFLEKNLDRLHLGMMEDGTAIGAGLSAALNRLRDLESKSKIVILMTDGVETVNKIPPLTAAEAAKALEIKVYTIGVGTKGQAPYPAVNALGHRTHKMVEVKIDETTLKEVAELTQGKYYRADNSKAFRDIYDEIDLLEKSDVEMNAIVYYHELFRWFVATGLVLLLFELVLNNTIWRKLP